MLCSAEFRAHAEPLADSDWSLQVATGPIAYSSSEYGTSGQRLNREAGTLGSVSITGIRHLGDVQIHLTGEQAASDVAYEGQTQGGAALLTQSRIRTSRASVGIAKVWLQQEQSTWSLLAGVDWQQIDRYIKGTAPNTPALPAGSQPLRETLDSWMVHAGVRHNFVVSRQIQLESEVQLRTAIHNRLKVDSEGLFEPLTLSPAHSMGWRLSLGAVYDWDSRLEIGMRLHREQFAPGASPSVTAFKAGIPVAQVRYPGSRQYQTAALIQARWRF